MSKKSLYIVGGILFLLFMKGFLKENREIRVEGKYLESLGGPFFEVHYRAETSIPFLCRDFSLFQGSHRETERLRYWAKTTGAHYEVTIPLDKKRWSLLCDFQPYSIWVEEQNLFEVTPDSITFVKEPYADRTIRVTKFIAQNGDSYEIDFGEMLSPQERTSTYKEQVKYAKYKSMAPDRETQTQMKILFKLLIAPHIEKYKKTPDGRTGQRLLRQKNKIPDYVKKLTFVDGYPVDMWGNPFQYRGQKQGGRFSPLFSFGPDGVESDDDINIRGVHNPQDKVRAYNRELVYFKSAEDREKTKDALWLIRKIFKAYMQVHKKIPSQKVGEALLRLEGDLSIYFDKGITENYVKELKETFTYDGGYPLDMWNNRFHYDAKRARVYSTGEDGAKSQKDDIYKNLRGR